MRCTVGRASDRRLHDLGQKVRLFRPPTARVRSTASAADRLPTPCCGPRPRAPNRPFVIASSTVHNVDKKHHNLVDGGRS
jgi:hypothetical protein